MKRFTPAVLLAASLLVPAVAFAAPPATPDWQPLFGNNLADAQYSKQAWTQHDGVLEAHKDQTIWTTKEYKNFVVDLDFKNAQGTNSGVVVYCSDRKNWIPNSIEVQILDDYSDHWAKVDPDWKCASIFGHKPPTKQTVKHAGEWNHMTVTCRGPIISVELNGEKVNEVDLRQYTNAKKNLDGTPVPPWLAKKPLSQQKNVGYIGLQGKHGQSPVYFRNMRIRDLD